MTGWSEQCRVCLYVKSCAITTLYIASDLVNLWSPSFLIDFPIPPLGWYKCHIMPLDSLSVHFKQNLVDDKGCAWSTTRKGRCLNFGSATCYSYLVLVICRMSVVSSGYSGFLHQWNWHFITISPHQYDPGCCWGSKLPDKPDKSCSATAWQDLSYNWVVFWGSDACDCQL